MLILAVGIPVWAPVYFLTEMPNVHRSLCWNTVEFWQQLSFTVTVCKVYRGQHSQQGIRFREL